MRFAKYFALNTFSNAKQKHQTNTADSTVSSKMHENKSSAYLISVRLW